MKLRSTIPKLSTRRPRSVALAVITLMMVVSLPIQALVSSGVVHATETSAQISARLRALREDLARYENQAAQLRGQASSLKQALNQLGAERAAVQAKIDINQAEHDELVLQIKQTEDQIKLNRDILGDTIADMYLGDQISPLEMVFSSSNISDFLDKQEYRSSMRDNLQSRIAEIKELKKSLENNKKNVESVLNDQKVQRDILSEKVREQQRLLANTQGQESRFKAAIAKSREDIGKAEEAHAAAVYRELLAQGGGGAAQTDYPYATKTDTTCRSTWDPWGYCFRQCTSYVAWKLSKDPRNSGFSYRGHAKYWWNAGKRVSASEVAHGHVIVTTAGQYGHVMFVESVSGDTIRYTDYNGRGGRVSPGQGTINRNVATNGISYKVISFR
jgi:surface antigen